MPGRNRLRRVVLTLSPVGALVLIALLVAACGSDDSGSPPEHEPSATPQPIPSVLPTFPSTLHLLELQPAVMTPSDIEMADYAAYSAWVDEITGSVTQYWLEWWKRSGEGPWEGVEIRNIPPGDSGTTCNGLDVGVRGSFYCPEEDYVGLQEAGQLLPFYFQIGPYAVATVIAHEYGHIVQHNLGFAELFRTHRERQADCLAGAWFKHFELSGGFEDPAPAFLQAYDAMRTTETGGDLVDFFDALREGYNGGPERCLELFAD